MGGGGPHPVRRRSSRGTDTDTGQGSKLGRAVMACSLLAGSLLIGSTTTLAEERRAKPVAPRTLGLGPGRLVVPTNVDIDPVRLEELIGRDSAAIAMGEEGPSSDLPTQLRRRLRQVWELTVDADTAADMPLFVNVDLRGLDGRPNALTLPDGSDVIPVDVEPGPIQRENFANGTVRFSGEVSLFLDMLGINRGGDYAGVLTITLNQL